ncbi:MAG TPA: hypothetical protein VD770_02860, partial [Coxiellaceae bacterium]|nr:hypothetical protein [Coxiellaceae bacterium]
MQEPKSSKELFVQTWSLYKTKLKALLGINIAPLLLGILIGAVALLVTNNEGLKTATATGTVFLLGLIAGIVLVITNILSQIATLFALDGNNSIKQAYSLSLGKFWIYLGISLWVGLVVLFGFIMFIIPGFLFAIWFSFAVYAVILDNVRFGESLGYSKRLVKGYYWKVLGRYLLLAVAMLILYIPVFVLDPDGSQSLIPLMETNLSVKD